MSPTNLLWTQWCQSARTFQMSHQPSRFLSLCQHRCLGRWYQVFLRADIQSSAMQPLIVILQDKPCENMMAFNSGPHIFLKKLGIYFGKVFFANGDMNHMTCWLFFLRKCQRYILGYHVTTRWHLFKLPFQFWIANLLMLESLRCSFEWELKPSDDSIWLQAVANNEQAN